MAERVDDACDVKIFDSDEDSTAKFSDNSNNGTQESSPESLPDLSSENCPSVFSRNLIPDIEKVFLAISDKITQEMLNSPTKKSPGTGKPNTGAYSSLIDRALLSVRSQIIKEINQSDWNLSVMQALPCRRSVKQSAKLRACKNNEINSIFESSFPLDIPTNLDKNDKSLIEMEMKALEHRLMFVLLSFLVVKEFRTKESPSIADNLDDYYNCFRIMINEHSEIRRTSEVLSQVNNLGRNFGRVQRFRRLINNNNKHIGQVWYGMFLARVQAGIMEGNIENVISNINDIGVAIEGVEVE
ncbi:hypothetical protein TNIN_107511 [Trichonephila inaurata madagascariensis]|uniref:Uncharacterized protein n=1 Tax=Trichonephila inaurata madagascariensis TaxID=2747483 RepID=A0A8X6WQ06_9ARAC|nr:hypothetical protein TNIN_107511 [Trichonephila inaurata madagascariensis]